VCNLPGKWTPKPNSQQRWETCFHFTTRIYGIQNTDLPKKHQKAIPISVINKIAKQDSTKLKQAKAQLATVGIFFAMRSYEYLKVKAVER
jgi:hypothetical protein